MMVVTDSYLFIVIHSSFSILLVDTGLNQGKRADARKSGPLSLGRHNKAA